MKKGGSPCELHGVCPCTCRSVCACYFTDIVKGIMLHDLSVYVWITVALLPCYNIDSVAVTFNSQRKISFFKETNTVVQI